MQDQLERHDTNMTPPLSVVIESILFFEGGSMSVQRLAKATNSSEADVETALGELRSALEGRGVSLVQDGTTVALGTAPETREIIEAMRRDELEGPLGKAGLETLAIIIYRGPLSRADIEYIRGVNASSILRSLLVRGLIERVQNPKDSRSFLYKPTTELPAYFGVQSLSDLPGFSEVSAEIQAVLAERDADLSSQSESDTTE